MEVNGRFSNFTFIILSIIFFILIFFQTHKGSSFIKSSLSSINSFFLNFSHSVKENVKGLTENFQELKKLKKEKEELEKINLSLKIKIFNLENELQKYRKIGNLFEGSEFNFLIAETIGWDITNPYVGIVINKGTKDGVKNYSPVLDRWFNLVGRVLKASYSFSEVILLTNFEFSASVKIKENVFAILSGENSSLCTLNYITAESEISEGMEVYTSGFDRIFPPGIRVGKIEKIGKYDGGIRIVNVKPYANLKSLGIVLVLKK